MTTRSVENDRTAIDTAVGDMTLVDVLHNNATEYADRPAIHWKDGDLWKHLTWSQYEKVVTEAAAGLLTLGVGKGDFVAIMAGNRPEHVIADLAAVHTGAAAVTFYSTLAQEQIVYIANHCQAKVAVLEDLSFMKRWEAAKPELTHLSHVVLMEGAENYDTSEWVLSWEDLLARGREALAKDQGLVKKAADQIQQSDLATLIYTSGTTGTPKGVAITHRNVVWTTECLVQTAHIRRSPRMVSYLPLAHIAERLATHYLGMYLAGEVYYCPALDQVLDYITKARPQLFVAVPRVWEKFQARLFHRFDEDPKRKGLIMSAIENAKAVVKAEQEGRNPGVMAKLKNVLFERLIFSKVRHGLGMDAVELAITAAAPIDPNLIVFFRALGIPLYELYGMSESTGPASTNLPGNDRIGTIGKPILGVEVELAEDGEILMRGGVVTAGYYKMPLETSETFDSDGWLHSGDLGKYDDDGFLSIIGRKKEIIITAAGKNIAPAKLETILKNHPLIAQACLVGDGRQYLTMLVALDHEEAPGWATAHGMNFSDMSSFSQSPQVQAEVQSAIEAANEHVSRVEQVKKFAVVPDVWGPETGEITPSLKLKRSVVLGKYSAEIEKMYV